MFQKVEEAGRDRARRPAQHFGAASVSPSAGKRPPIERHTGQQTGCLVLECAALCVAVPRADTDITHLAFDLQTLVEETGSASGMLVLPRHVAEALPSHRLDEWAAMALSIWPCSSHDLAAEAERLLNEHATRTAVQWQAYKAQLPPAQR